MHSLRGNVYKHCLDSNSQHNCSAHAVGEEADCQTCHGLKSDVGQTLGTLPAMKDGEQAAPPKDTT